MPDGDGWTVEAENVSVPFDTQEQAIAAGRSAAESRFCELVIHDADGQVQETRPPRFPRLTDL
jgi:hypothetical protein